MIKFQIKKSILAGKGGQGILNICDLYRLHYDLGIETTNFLPYF